MNLQLYNALNKANDFYQKNEREYKPKIEACNRMKNILTASLNYSPRFKTDPFPWKTFFISLLFFFPISTIIILISYLIVPIVDFIKYHREKIKFDPFLHRKQVLKDLQENDRKLEYLKKQRLEHYNSCKDCINIIPEAWRSARHIDGIFHYIKIGRATTLEQAINFHCNSLERMADDERRKEEQEELQRMHKETQDALNHIERNTKRTQEETESIRRTIDDRYWW